MINWKLRIKNKVTAVALVTLIISIVYQTLAIFGIIPTVDQQQIVNIACEIIDVLALIGIITDPTTEGIADSSRALSYDAPATETVVRHDDNRKGE